MKNNILISLLALSPFTVFAQSVLLQNSLSKNLCDIRVAFMTDKANQIDPHSSRLLGCLKSNKILELKAPHNVVSMSLSYKLNTQSDHWYEVNLPISDIQDNTRVVIRPNQVEGNSTNMTAVIDNKRLPIQLENLLYDTKIRIDNKNIHISATDPHKLTMYFMLNDQCVEYAICSDDMNFQEPEDPTKYNYVTFYKSPDEIIQKSGGAEDYNQLSKLSVNKYSSRMMSGDIFNNNDMSNRVARYSGSNFFDYDKNSDDAKSYFKYVDLSNCSES